MEALQLSQAVCRAFTVALLLCGDTDIAEEVVQEAIKSLDAEDLFGDALLICVTTLSLPRCGNPSAHSALPDELQNVLLLPRIPRQCFVLRILVGLPEIRCAALLQVEPAQISDALGMAVSELAFAMTLFKNKLSSPESTTWPLRQAPFGTPVFHTDSRKVFP